MAQAAERSVKKVNEAGLGSLPLPWGTGPPASATGSYAPRRSSSGCSANTLAPAVNVDFEGPELLTLSPWELAWPPPQPLSEREEWEKDGAWAWLPPWQPW
jgi:hypothetical protein